MILLDLRNVCCLRGFVGGIRFLCGWWLGDSLRVGFLARLFELGVVWVGVGFWVFGVRWDGNCGGVAPVVGT